MEHVKRIYLDLETTGILGKVNLVQVGEVKEGRLEIQYYRKGEFGEVLKRIDSPEILLIGWNIGGFDVWKMYQELGEVERPFHFRILDLMIHAKKNPPLSHFSGLRSCYVRKIWSEFFDVVSEFYREKMENRILEEYGFHIPVIVGKHASKVGKDIIEKFFDISFTLDLNFKLKNVVKLLGLEKETGKIEETEWCFPEEGNFSAYDWSEKQRQEHEDVFQKNEKILENPQSKFWEYARRDIEYVWKLDEYFGFPDPCIDSRMTEILSYTRHVGFGIDHAGLYTYIEELKKEVSEIQNTEELKNVNLGSPAQRKELLLNLGFSPEEVRDTGKESLEHLKESFESFLSDGFIVEGLEVEKKRSILEKLCSYGSLVYRLNTAEKLAKQYRCHPELNPIGTTTGRMSGTGGLNFQGIAREKDGIRKFFRVSQMGDFDQLELRIAGAVFSDPNFLSDLSRDVHLQTATSILGISYEEAEKRKGEKDEEVKKARSCAKGINFALLYYCQKEQIAKILFRHRVLSPVPHAELAEKIYDSFYSRYSVLAEKNEALRKSFCTINPEDWKSVEKPMQDEIRPILGKPREFRLATIFLDCILGKEKKDNAEKAWGEKREKKRKSEILELLHTIYGEEICEKEITRSSLKGVQKAENTVHSAYLGSALEIQQGVYRKAGNAQIQMVGAFLTKELMLEIWEAFHVPMLNIHDEILVPDGYGEKYGEIREKVEEFCRKKKKEIKNLNLTMGWESAKNWAEKA